MFEHKVFPDIPRGHIIAMWNHDELLPPGISFKDERFPSRAVAKYWLKENHKAPFNAWAITFTEEEKVKYMVGGNCSY